MKIKYLVSDRNVLLSIHSDISVHVYLHQRQCDADSFSEYPLRITLKKNSFFASYSDIYLIFFKITENEQQNLMCIKLIYI